MPESVERLNMLLQDERSIYYAPPLERATLQGVDEITSKGLKWEPQSRYPFRDL